MCNVAVVGYGYWGPNLVRNLMSLPECSLACVCDMDPRRREAVKAIAPGVRVTPDLNEVLGDEEVDAVFIVTPVKTHYPLARAALLAGKHVFVEKPLASSSQECEKLIESAETAGLTLMTGHTFLYSAPVRKIREIISAGEIGEIMHISARRLNLGLFQRDINVVWDLAPHDISIILSLLEQEPSEVNCQGRAHIYPGTEDVASVSLGFADGTFANIQVSWIDPRKVREITIVGSRRMIVYDDLEPLEKIKVYDKSVEAPPRYGTFAEFQCAYHYGDVISPYLKLEEPLAVECRHFLECIRTGQPPLTDGRDGLRVTRVLEAASRSLALGGAAVALSSRAAARERQPA